MSEQEQQEQVEEKPLSIFITGAGQGVGLAAATEANRRGYKVVGTTTLGTVGAYRIRRAGGLPLYPDLTRESAIYSALQMAQADVIIHAAPQVVNGIPHNIGLDYDELLPYIENSTRALMSAAGRANIKRIIHISAASIYGDTHHEQIKEDGSLHLDNELAKALHEAEESVLDGGIPGYVLRTGYIYGTHQGSADVAQAMRDGQAFPRSNQPTSWANEDDVASAALIIAEKDSDEQTNTIYNIASEETVSPDEFIKQFGEAYGTGEPGTLAGFFLQFRTSELQRHLIGMSTLLDTSKAREELDWSPEGTIAGGLDKMLLLWRSEEAGITAQVDSNLTGLEIVKA